MSYVLKPAGAMSDELMKFRGRNFDVVENADDFFKHLENYCAGFVILF